METIHERLVHELRRAGMRDVPDRFSVASAQQAIPRDVLTGIDEFIRLFERVTTRPAWQDAFAAGTRDPERRPGGEACFFSAWDFHLPPGRPEAWQLIEFNDNGSGLLFAALINRTLWELSGASLRAEVETPPAFDAVVRRVADSVEREATAFFGARPEGALLIVDDADSLRAGRFRDELALLRDGLGRAGWKAGLAAPEELRRAGARLLWKDCEVAFVVNRSTDFLFEDERLAPLREAWRGGHVYVAPNPFTYATRSDKRLLEPLSRPVQDAPLGIRPQEREIFSAHVPETWVVREDNLDALASRKGELVFKPAHGFAGRGLLPSAGVGRSRLRRLLQRGEAYVAQRRVEKSRLVLSPPPPGSAEVPVWTDLRVWAWRGERLLVSGRASRHPERIDLEPPAGWLATYPAALRADRRQPRRSRKAALSPNRPGASAGRSAKRPPAA
jgi:hypothetical protein